MSQSLEVNIKTTSDVPQAMDKAKTATVSYAKQLEDIQKKFSTSFKDIFLSIAGPMAIFSAIQNTIVSHFEKIKKAQEDANQAAIDGTNKKMAAEDVYYARRIENIKKERLASEQAKAQPIETTKQFLLNDPRAQEALGNRPFGTRTTMLGGGDPRETLANMYANDPEIQKAVRKILERDMASQPIAGTEAANKTANFKGPDGFSNVVGVGANPVMEAMNAQLEEQQKQTALLQNLVDRNPFMPADFTKGTQTK
jgi:hypothetical protein